MSDQVFHRHAGIDWPVAQECPLCEAENDARNYRNWYQDARSREQGERILRLRAEREARDLRDLVREMQIYVPLDNGLLDRARAALGEE